MRRKDSRVSEDSSRDNRKLSTWSGGRIGKAMLQLDVARDARRVCVAVGAQ
jgi:hypothetical protein